MKPAELNQTLLALAKAMNSVGAKAQAEAVSEIAISLGKSPKPTIAATLKVINDLPVQKNSLVTALPAANLASIFQEVRNFTSQIGKAGFNNDLSLIIQFLQRHGSEDLGLLLKRCEERFETSQNTRSRSPMPAEPDRRVVQHYMKLLEESLGDEGFLQVHNSVASDKSVGKPEAIELAQLFAGKNTKSRPAALKAILQRHTTLMSFRAKKDARAGRSAA